MKFPGKNNQSQKSLQRSSSESRRATRRARVVRSNVGTGNITSTRKPKSFTRHRYIVLAIVLGVLLYSGYIGRDLSVNASSKAVERNVKNVANEYFSGLQNWWWFVSEDELSRQIKATSPYVKEVEVSRAALSRNVKLTISERAPSLRVRAAKQQFIVSDDGIVLKISDSYHDLPLVYDESDLPAPEEGSSYLPTITVNKINEIKKLLPTNKKIKIKEFVLSDNTREIRVQTKAGFYIKFSSSDAIKSQITDLKRVSSKISSKTEYVDLRFSGKVFIK